MDYNYDPLTVITERGAFLIPYLPRDMFMLWPWLGCLQWTFGQADAVEAFRRETGCQWSPATMALDQLIDQATEAEQAFLIAFVVWFNTTVWGDPEIQARLESL